jgi:CBS domain-containing protein
MKVRDIMTTQVEVAEDFTSCIQLANMMKRENVGAIPVCNERKLHGIVTDRDIIIRVVAEGKDCANLRASDIMSTNPISIGPDADIHEAAQLMSDNQIRRLPVVENEKLVGILALGDLAVENIHQDEAGEALSDISQGIQH